MEKEDKNLNNFLVGYTNAMLQQLSKNEGKSISLLDFDEGSRKKILSDCASFSTISSNLINKAIINDDTYSWKMAGWDFWETRNSTGLGFEDKADYDENKVWKNLFSRAQNKPVNIIIEGQCYKYETDDYSFQNPEIIKAIQEKRYLEEAIPKTYDGVKELVEIDERIISRPKLKI